MHPRIAGAAWSRKCPPLSGSSFPLEAWTGGPSRHGINLLSTFNNHHQMKHFITLAIATLTPPLHVRADEAQTTKLMEAGKTAYATCMACHGPDGKGTAAGPKKMAPPLSGSPLVTGAPSLTALVVLKGIAKENQDYIGMMTPMEAVLSDDEKLAALLTYVRNSFGNSAPLVTPADAAKFREQWKEQKSFATRAQLKLLEDATKK
ncbi:MAG: cytochrome c [Verrucomicrobiaceae bacterium]|nr:MAG: cytochrome c [Verrucomicrobiaceae bacterium]